LEQKSKQILITGSAGFIGMHLSKKLLQEGYSVIGIDNINSYYDQQLKIDRLQELGVQYSASKVDFSSSIYENFTFKKVDITEAEVLDTLFTENNFTAVIHLAAQAGVRYSIKNPRTYIDNNLNGFFNVLDCTRQHKVPKFLYASSSSVYGNSKEIPFSETQHVDQPVSLYAATKKSNELIAHSYAEIYKMNVIGMRFFTVYGPYGRPDMAYYSFAENIKNNTPIKVYNHGNLSRDFTYIDDITQGIKLLLEKAASPETNYEIYNLANSGPVNLLEFIETLEQAMGKEAIKEYVEMQAGDVSTTFADITRLKQLGYQPTTHLKEGIAKFVAWYNNYTK
jgi:UDP-glucuronate 4-epimerase